jgi:hypothetical protein
MSRVLFVLFLAASAHEALASGRCNDTQLAGGLHCECPDINAQLQSKDVFCPAGFLPVVYDLAKPFPPDGTTSRFTIRGSRGSMCPTLKHKVAVTGHVVVCWGPKEDDSACRPMVIPYNSFCIDTADEPLGDACTGDCANVSTNIIAIMNAGAAHFRVCPPIAPATSCRSTSPGGEEMFRFQPGGWCVTEECVGSATGSFTDGKTCVGGWGATYLGFGHHQTRKGWYDWESGAFMVDYRGKRPVCGALGACIGDRGEWTGTLVATPTPSSPNAPPCLTKPGDTCSSGTCMP